jgi:hypothetical protein
MNFVEPFESNRYLCTFAANFFEIFPRSALSAPKILQSIRPLCRSVLLAKNIEGDFRCAVGRC